MASSTVPRWLKSDVQRGYWRRPWTVPTNPRKAATFKKLLRDHGHAIPAAAARPSLNARVMAWLGKRLGPGYLLPLLLREEGREVKGYIDLHRDSSGDARTPCSDRVSPMLAVTRSRSSPIT